MAEPNAHSKGARSPTSNLVFVGQLVLSLVEASKAQYGVLRTTLYFCARGKPQPGAVLRAMYEIGNESLLFLCVVMGTIGMIMVYQGGVQIQRVVPDMSQLGASYIELLVRDLAATICALMLATRVGAGIAAEIGSMVVTEQVDALRMCATDPVDYLIRPRFLASIIMTVMLVVIAGFVAFWSGMVTAEHFFGLNRSTFADLSRVRAADVGIGVVKSLAYGAAIPIVSGYSGLSTYGGSEGVGIATTRAVVNSSLAVIVLDFLISGAGFLLFG